ncbi:MAG: PEP-CTERM sorting domain-containing protein, partial [Solirubrobacterales bacterium]
IENSSLSLEGGASFLNAPGATLRFTGQSSLLGGGAGTSFLNQGVVIDENDNTFGSSSAQVNLPFVNEGTFEIRGERFGQFSSTTSFTDFLQTDGMLWLNGGNISSFTGAPLRIDGGSVIGNGNLNVNIENRGRIAPGDVGEPGRLVFGTDLSLFDGSELEFEIGGKAPGLEFDMIDAYQIFLDGELSVRFIHGFENAIQPGDVFEIATSLRSLQGVLDNVVSGARLLTSDGLGSFAAFYGSTSPFDPNRIVLTDFRAVPEPAAGALFVVAVLGICARRRVAHNR